MSRHSTEYRPSLPPWPSASEPWLSHNAQGQPHLHSLARATHIPSPSPATGEGVPPPLPPRPTGLGTSSGRTTFSATFSGFVPSSPGGTSYTSFPPPPPSPNRRPVGSAKPPLPPRPHSSTATLSPYPDHLPIPPPPSLSPESQSPHKLTSFPPPPPIRPASGSSHQHQSSLDLDVPSEPPPPYTLVDELPSRTFSLSPPDPPVIPPQEEVGPVSNPQSPHELSFFPRPPLKSPAPPEDQIDELLELVGGTSLLSTEPTAERLSGNSDTSLKPPSEQTKSSYGVDQPPMSASAKSSANVDSHDPKAPGFEAGNPDVVTSCIDIPVTFTTAWYSHPAAPDFLVCSRCYTDYILPTSFRDVFGRSTFSDGKPRRCTFSRPRMKDHLFPSAVASNSLKSALDWMRLRGSIPDCKGVVGVKGETGIKWYRPITADIPGFVACQACYEDHILTSQLLATYFEATEPQGAHEIWACDMAVPFIQKEYQERAKQSEWFKFASKTKARMSLRPCPQRNPVPASSRTWFTPKHGTGNLVFCAACYYDQVTHTGEESKWQEVDSLGNETRCNLGQYNIKIAMGRAHETKDFSIFWNAVEKIAHEKPCEDDGITDGVWYTLPSNPSKFQICQACFFAIVTPLDVAEFFVRKAGVVPGVTLRCGFSLSHPRLRNFMPKLLEMYFTRDPAAFDKYVSEYAAIPPCPKDNEVAERRWYGWDECTICLECFHDFTRHHSLAARMMSLDNTFVEEQHMCEMYSRRMRGLYLSCGEKGDPAELLQFAAHRRRVHAETVPLIRLLLAQQRQAVNQQRPSNGMGSMHSLGSGLGNSGTVSTMKTLEERWKSVE